MNTGIWMHLTQSTRESRREKWVARNTLCSFQKNPSLKYRWTGDKVSPLVAKSEYKETDLSSLLGGTKKKGKIINVNILSSNIAPENLIQGSFKIDLFKKVASFHHKSVALHRTHLKKQNCKNQRLHTWQKYACAQIYFQF